MKNSSFSIRWQGILYTRQRLKLQLKSFFGESVLVHQQTTHSQPELVYSSELSLQTVINAAFKQSTSEPPAPKSSREERTTKDIVDMTDRKGVLYQAAMIVKADINETS